MAVVTGGISTRLICKAESSASPCRPVSSLGSKCVSFRIAFIHPSISLVRRVANTNEHSGGDKRGRMIPRAMFSWASDPPPLPDNSMEFEDARMEVLEPVGELNSIADFTRFRDNGAQGAELQTAIITYKTRFPLSLFRPQQVFLCSLFSCS